MGKEAVLIIFAIVMLFTFFGHLISLKMNKVPEAFKTSKFSEFPHVLFRDVVINEERILKAISKG